MCFLIEFFVTENESVGNIHQHLCYVYESATVHSTASHWVKRTTASKTGKAELHDCLAQDVMPRGEPINSDTYIKNSGSISNKFGLTRILQKSCFSMIMQGFTQV
jgi:hypothetical protein